MTIARNLHAKVELEIRELAEKYAKELKVRMQDRVDEMEADDNSHYLIYRVLGISDDEGKLIDVYQNKGRFLYKYAGSFLEDAAKLCFLEKFPESGSLRIENTLGSRPKTFEIDCLVANRRAFEIKWRDATTDGDHITKEHTRLKVIAAAGYTPVRIMFYYPNRDQAIRIQQTLMTLYQGVGGHYFYGDAAWDYIRNETDVDLKCILERIAGEHQRSAK
ncbi:MAG: ApaLI family restriction endonuclease [Terracidiphilus sp.]